MTGSPSVRKANFLQRQKSNQNSGTPSPLCALSVVILFPGNNVRIRQRRYGTKRSLPIPPKGNERSESGGWTR
jgi:hypothetical protein